MPTPELFSNNTERDDQIDALSQAIGVPSNFEVRPLEEVTGYDESFTVADQVEITYTRTTSSDNHIDLQPGGIYGVSEMDTIVSRNNMYGGCIDCRVFSNCFGGSMYEGKIIRTEEDFEIIKAKFVSHVNDKHKDLIAKKRAAPHVNKKFEKVKETPLILTSTPNSGNIFFASNNIIHDESDYISLSDARRYASDMFEREYSGTFSNPEPTVDRSLRQTPAERPGFRTRITNRHD